MLSRSLKCCTMSSINLHAKFNKKNLQFARAKAVQKYKQTRSVRKFASQNISGNAFETKNEVRHPENELAAQLHMTSL